MIIAVDGPTASGKGTIAKALAVHFGVPHLDTGLLYRAVGRQVALTSGNPDDPADALAACAFPDALLDDPVLRDEATGGLASRVSIHPSVRAALFERQRAFATQPGGAVLDGRDIGTVIAPDADAKLFVTASVDARAHRRWREMIARLGAANAPALSAIAADLAERDARDAGRSTAPLAAAADAVKLDTSRMDAAEAIAAAIAIVAPKLAATRAMHPAVTIHDFRDDLARSFHDINVEWISAMFALEPADRAVLDHPRAEIIDRGGAILFAEAGDLGIVGTAALRPAGDGGIELTKMGVLERARGLKVGERLLEAIIARAQALGADPLYLLTNARCEAAIHIYAKFGFVHDAAIMERYSGRYSRCDVAMRYAGGTG